MENDLYVDSFYQIEHTHHSEDSLGSIDTFLIKTESDTTILVESTEKDYRVLQKLIEREDYGKNIFIILVSVFIIYSIYRKRNG
jgi:hypothetical protein